MIAEKMKPFVQNNSAIRMMFEEGNRLRAKYGADKVYDFSLGNPSVPAPDCVREAIIDLVNNEESTVLHGYMSNAGFEDVRETIAQSLNRRFGTAFSAHNLIMTVGAASGLNVILKTILNPGEEVIVFAPYFLEYGAYVRNYDGKLVEISPNTETFQPNLKELEEKITANTRAVIVNTPHNPTGVVYSEETIKELAAILEKKQQEFGSVIYLISDEPYRELAYDGVEVPYLTKYYKNTVVGYSYSKSLSLPGERIGYLVIPDELEDSATVITAAAIAGLPVPFAPVHLLFINLLTDSLPAIALGMEPHSKAVMDQKPRPVNESILTKAYLVNIGTEGLCIGIMTMAAFLIGYRGQDAVLASTMAFGTLCMSRLVHGFNCKDDKPVIFSKRFFNNKYLIGAFVLGTVLITGVLTIPGLHAMFKVVTLNMTQLMTVYGLAFLNLPVIQGLKYLKGKTKWN